MENAKVVILCGGRGTRMGGVTNIVPKPMVRIAGEKPILWHIMKIYAYYGYTDFILCLGYKGEQIKEYFLNYHLYNSNCTVHIRENKIKCEWYSTREELDWRITLVDTGLDAQTGARLKRIERFVDGDNFMLTYGDGLSDVNIQKLIKFHIKQGKLVTVTAVSPPSRFGELLLDKEKVALFEEKPMHSNSSRINGGFFVFRKEVFKYLSNDDDCRLEGEPLKTLVKAGQVAAWRHDGYWQCMDTVRDLDALSKAWRSGQAPWKVWS